MDRRQGSDRLDGTTCPHRGQLVTEMTRWEYMAVVLPHDRTRDEKVADENVQRIPQIEAILNAWGEEGWEAVGFAVTLRSGSGGTSYPRLILKRPKA